MRQRTRCRLASVGARVVLAATLGLTAGAAVADCPPGLDGAALVSLAEETRNHGRTVELLICAFNRETDDRLKAAAIRNLIGREFENEQRYQDALLQYESGLSILSTGDTSDATDLEALLQSIRGTEKSYAGRQKPAISQDLYTGDTASFDELSDRSRRDAERDLQFVLAVNAGNMYALQGQYPQADIYYARAAEVIASSDDALRRARLASNRAWVALADGRPEEAQTILDTVPDPGEAGFGAPALRKALLAAAVGLREQGRHDEAVTRLAAVADVYEEAGDRRGQGRVLAHLGTAHLVNDDAASASAAYRRALEINETANDSEIARHANGGLARASRRLGKLEDAQRYYDAYFEALGRRLESWNTDQGRARILADQQALFRDFVSIATQLASESGDWSVVRAAAEQGRSPVLTELLRLRRCAPGSEPGVLTVGPALFGDNWDRMRNEHGAHAPMAQMSPGAALDQMAPGVRRDCAPDAVDEEGPGDDAKPPTLLEYYVTEDAVVITVRSADERVRGAVIPITAAELEDAINDYLLVLGVSDARGMAVDDAFDVGGPMAGLDETEIARRLHEWLIEPVGKWLPEVSRETLLIVPHGDLWRLPFGALLAEDGQRLASRHAVTYLSSETAWREMNRQPRRFDHRNVRAYVAGNPTMPLVVAACGQSGPQIFLDVLPGAEAEALAIAEMVAAKDRDLFTGADADRLRLEGWHGAYSVLHLATHGVACPNDPLSSFIALADIMPGGLEVDPDARELRRRDDPRLPVQFHDPDQVMGRAGWDDFVAGPYSGVLSARDVINRFSLRADLVTLSACQTGIGQLSGEGMIGFTRAFLAAGSRSLLVSLWRVDDRSTTLLMTEFYEAYLRHGNKALALQEAMETTRTRYPHPRHWAAFSLVGLAE